MGIFYVVLLRNFTPIINKSGYESLKSSNLKTIKNDSLRFKIIALYDFHYKIIEKLEDQVAEMQMFHNYFAPINSILHPYMQFDANGKLSGISMPINITENNRKEILSYLWRIETV